jgi:hypothetical protein
MKIVSWSKETRNKKLTWGTNNIYRCLGAMAHLQSGIVFRHTRGGGVGVLLNPN